MPDGRKTPTFSKPERWLAVAVTVLGAGVVLLGKGRLAGAGPEPRPSAPEARVSQRTLEAARQEHDRVQALLPRLVKIRKQLGGARSTPDKPDIDLAGLRSLMPELARLAGMPRRGVDMKKLADLVSQRKSRAAELTAEIRTAERQVKEYKRLLAHTPGVRRRVVVRLASWEAPLPGTSPTFFVCRAGRVFPFDVKGLSAKFTVGLRDATRQDPDHMALDSDGIADVVDHFRNRDLGDMYFLLRVGVDRSGLLLTFEPRLADQGETLEHIQGADSVYRRALQRTDPATRSLRFLVYADSFELYLEARQLAGRTVNPRTPARLRMDWFPYAMDQPLQKVITFKRRGDETP